jgi:hypothetical protein
MYTAVRYPPSSSVDQIRNGRTTFWSIRTSAPTYQTMEFSPCARNSRGLHTSEATCGGLRQNFSKCPRTFQIQRVIFILWDVSCFRCLTFLVALICDWDPVGHDRTTTLRRCAKCTYCCSPDTRRWEAPKTLQSVYRRFFLGFHPEMLERCRLSSLCCWCCRISRISAVK